MKEENSSFFFLFKIVGCKQIKCKCLLAADCPMGALSPVSSVPLFFQQQDISSKIDK